MKFCCVVLPWSSLESGSGVRGDVRCVLDSKLSWAETLGDVMEGTLNLITSFCDHARGKGVLIVASFLIQCPVMQDTYNRGADVGKASRTANLETL